MYYKPSRSKEVSKLLRHRNVNNSVFRTQKFEIDEYVRRIEYKPTEKTVKRVRESEQVNIFQATLESPLAKNYVYCISGVNFAEKAQCLASMLFESACVQFDKQHSPHLHLPYWHYVIGGYRDSLRDDENFQHRVGKPALLVIDGLSVGSTDIKLEKARDLLEYHSDIPRVVVTCGVEPTFFMHQKLHLAVNRVVYIGDTKSVDL